MPFNIDRFKSEGLVYGGARPSLFNVEFNVPNGLGLNFKSVDKAQFVCRAAELPASQISSIDVGYFGRKIKIAGDRTFTDWTATIMNDEDFSVRSLFESWSNAINRHVSNVRNINANGERPGGTTYKSDFIIKQYGKNGTTIRSYKLVGAFPTNISAISLDWDNQNQIETFQTTFAYDYWLPYLEGSASNDGGINPYLNDARINGSNGP
jgi:hypothetical protein